MANDCADSSQLTLLSRNASLSRIWHGLLVVSLLTIMAGPLFTAQQPARAEQLSSLNRGILEQMLKQVDEAVRKNYYDPTFGGVDMDGAYTAAQQKVAQANSIPEGYEAIADMLRQLNDSHTMFLPPPHPFTVDQGWEMQLIGDKAYVSRVKPGSDAAAKGLKQGDRILMIDGVKPSRANWYTFNYDLHVLSPRSSLHMVVVTPGEAPRPLVTESVVKPRSATLEMNTNDYWRWFGQRQYDLEKYQPREVVEDDALIWKLPAFNIKDDYIDAQFHKARKYKTLIIDLRGNGGGSEAALIRMVSNLFDREVLIGNPFGREKTKPLVAKGVQHPYQANLIVLVDSESRSGSEIFARVIQLEKRGVVIGDHTAGHVRLAETKHLTYGWGTGSTVNYGAEVSIADLKMSDGKSLEGAGVTPDEILLPSPEEFAANADPQLARALQIGGVMLSAQKAGTLFPPVQ